MSKVRVADAALALVLLLPVVAEAVALLDYPGHGFCSTIVLVTLLFSLTLAWLSYHHLGGRVVQLLFAALFVISAAYALMWVLAGSWLQKMLLSFPENIDPMGLPWLMLIAPSLVVELVLMYSGARLPWMIELSTKVILLLLYWWALALLAWRVVGETSARVELRQKTGFRNANRYLPLFLVSLVAVGVRLYASAGFHAPVGWDVPIYIATLEHRVSPHEFPLMTKGAHLTFEAIGVFLQPVHELYWIRAVELLPLILMALGALGAYGLVYKLTKNPLASMVAGLLFAYCPGVLRHTSDLYKCLMGVVLSLYAAHCFIHYIEKGGWRWFVLTAILIFSLMLTHPYPASTLLYAVLAVALVLTVRKEAPWLGWGWRRGVLVALLLFLIAYLIVYGRIWMFYEERIEVPARLLVDFVSNFSPLVFVLLFAGFFYAFLEKGYGGKLVALWLVSSIVLAEQGLFHTYFPLDTPNIPRFVYVSSTPACILAATGYGYIEWLSGLRAPDRIRRLFLPLSVCAFVVVGYLYAVQYLNHCEELFGVRITPRDFVAINWLGERAPSPANSISPHYFDPWTGRIGYVNLQNLEFIEFYYVKSPCAEMDSTPLTNRVFDVGFPIHRINDLERAYDFETVSGLR